MTTVLAIDPGQYQSGYVVWDGKVISEMGIVKNEDILNVVLQPDSEDYVVIEMVGHYGTAMPAGIEVFETCIWIGRMLERAYTMYPKDKVQWVLRKKVCLHLCGSSRAKKTNTKQALKDRFEPDLKFRQRPKGVLKGLVDHKWSAMELAVTFLDRLEGREASYV